MGLTDVDDCVRAFDKKVRLDYAGVILAAAFKSRVGPQPQPLFTSVFAGFTNGSPRVVRIQWSALFRAAPLLRGKGTLRGRTERLMPGELWVVGSVKAFRSGVNQAPEDLETYGDVEYARRLIEAEIEANPQEVGPPIDILRITEAGPCWVDVKSTCAANVPLCKPE